MARKVSKPRITSNRKRPFKKTGRAERRRRPAPRATLEAAELLRWQGFTETEARVLLALFGENPATGYRISQTTGIGPAGVYLALDSLVDRGVVTQRSAEPRSYVPIPPAELTALLARTHQKTLLQLRTALEAKGPPSRPEVILSLRDYDAILARVADLLDSARKEVYLVVAEDEYHELLEEIRSVTKRKVPIRLLGLGEFARDLPFAVSHPLASDLTQEGQGRRLAYVVDRAEAGYGQVTNEDPEESRILTGRDPLFVGCMRDGLRHEMLSLLALRPVDIGRSPAEERLLERVLAD